MSSSPSFSFEQLTPPAEPALAARPAEVRAEAHAVVAAAQAEADRIRAEARHTGLEEGFAAGRAAALEELAPAAAALGEALAATREHQLAAAEAVEREAVELALKIAEKVVAATIEAQPERVLDVVRGVLRAVVEREKVTVLVNPHDLDLVRGAAEELVAQLGGIEHLEVQEDRRVDLGGAVVRTSVGEVDGRVETKLERARQALLAELGG